MASSYYVQYVYCVLLHTSYIMYTFNTHAPIKTEKYFQLYIQYCSVCHAHASHFV